VLTSTALVSLLLLSASDRPLSAYDQITEAFGKVVTTSQALSKELPVLAFHEGACLLGGSIREGGKFTYTISVKEGAEYVAVWGAYGNDTEVKIDVQDQAGKSAVSGTEENMTVFDAKASTRYTVSVTNKGATTFVGVALMRDGGGIKHPITSVTKAVGRMSKLIDEGFGEGFTIGPNNAMLVGTVLPPAGTYPRTGFKSTNWLALATTDGVAGDVALHGIDKDKNVVEEDTSKTADLACHFVQSLEGGNVQVTNLKSKKVLVLTAYMPAKS